jgi:hypothetical protein
MNLAQALKWKSRIIREVQSVQASISANNAFEVHVAEENPKPKIDIELAFTRLSDLQDALVKIKTAISKANAKEVTELTYQMSEKKAKLSFLSGLANVRMTPYLRNENLKMAYGIEPIEVAKKVKVVQNEIDKLQDQLDQINARTTIELDFDPEALVSPGDLA